MDEVRRPGDDELCGHVAPADGGWSALTVFGAELGLHADRADAEAQVLQEGLASLAERWTLRDLHTGEAEVVCIVEARADEVTLARGYYSMPGVPTLTLTGDQLVSGAWELRREVSA